MEEKVIKNILKEAMEENGVYFFENLMDEELDIDSLTFISIIVSIEEKLNIEIDNELLIEYPKTYNDFVQFAQKALGLYTEKHHYDN